jgi:3-deoxy-D-manno-octulosonate 8-phosphate phosphatase (KDO 8-P phosphatase)
VVKKIKLLALDIDGVLTDGRTTLGGRKPERKRLAFQDLDAINAAKRAGLKVALVTGESDGSVDLVAARTGVELVRRGAKDKLAALRSLARKLHLSLAEICYVGDGNRDAPALANVGLAFAPFNATFAAKQAAHRVVDKSGGHGVVAEVVRLLLILNGGETQWKFFEQKLCHYLAQTCSGSKSLNKKMHATLTRLALGLAHTAETEGKIFLYGNATAPVLDALMSGDLRWPVVELSAKPTWLERQAEGLARPGDFLVGFCADKRTPALTRTFRIGQRLGVRGFIFDGAAGLEVSVWRAVVAVAEAGRKNP